MKQDNHKLDEHFSLQKLLAARSSILFGWNQQ